MITLAELNGIMANAESLLTKLGWTYQRLTSDELSIFGASFERQFVLAYPEREIADIYKRHIVEILAGAMIAREQMSAEIDGEQPASGKVGGPVPIRAAYLGIGDDWDDVGDSGTFTTGSPQNWIHSGTPLMGGTDGNAVKIGENQVTVVIGIGSLHPSPKIESVDFWIDGKQKPVLITGWAQKMPNSLKIKELNSAYLFKEDTTVLAKIFASNIGGTVSTVSDIPYLLGVSYIKEDQLRKHDASEIPGTVADVIMTT
jgi:hypothetical protein